MADTLDPAFPILKQASAALRCQAWAVGGYVRDRLLGRPHPDLDVVAEGGLGVELARQFAALSKSPPPVIFERFGTAQVRFGESLVEFVSARKESYPPNSRKPRVEPAPLEEDLKRRDFTINTLVMSFDGNVEDRLGQGLNDLEAGVLRTPIDPRTTFADDPLRMLRAIRFGAQLGFELAPDLIPAMRELKDRARPPILSAERSTDELCKILVSERPAGALESLAESDLLSVLLPELAACRGVKQGGWHTKDVFGHTLEVIEFSPHQLLNRLAALFHDVGKPATAAADGSFHGHERVGAEMARQAMARLKVPGVITVRVARLVELHMRPVMYKSDWSDGAIRRLAVAAGEDVWTLMELARADVRASAYPRPEEVEELSARLREAVNETPTRLELPIRGEDIMSGLGLSPGPEVGRVKRALLDLVVEGKLDPTREAVLAFIEANRRNLLADGNAD